MTKPKTIPSTAARTPQKNNRLLYIIGAVVALGLVAAIAIPIALSGGGTSFEDEDIANAQVEVTGTALPLYIPDSGTGDQGLGLTIPQVSGADFDGNSVTISDDGRPKMIVFLAHWCPHCQTEVPIVQNWLASDPIPDGVDFYSVATSIDPLRGNYPPDAWLEGEGWTPPVIVDDAVSSASAAYGLSAFPYWVFVAGDGTVVGRRTGGLTTGELDQIVFALSAGTG